MPPMRNAMLWTIAGLLLAGCSGTPEPTQAVTLATTTSTRDSGLLDELLPMFEKSSGIEVKVIAVGSGQALELGRRGDADVLLTHAPAAELEFMQQGHGARRLPVMYNDFVLVGPNADPAGVGETPSIAEAFRRIAEAEAAFVSRGDDSGTHMKEQAIWETGSIDPSGAWYVRAGAGMSAALRMASERQAYTLSDRSTYLAQREALELDILSEGDPLLHNPYTVIVISAEMHPGVHSEPADRLADWLVSPEARAAIQEFGVDTFGQPLFFVERENAHAHD